MSESLFLRRVTGSVFDNAPDLLRIVNRSLAQDRFQEQPIDRGRKTPTLPRRCDARRCALTM